MDDAIAIEAAAPSSSTSKTGPPLDLIPAPLLHLFSIHPFNAIPASAIPLLTDILHHYLTLVTKRASRSAEHAQRHQLTPWDVVDSLHSIGAADQADLKTWLASEDRADWAERCTNGWTDERARDEYQARKLAWRQKIAFGIASTSSHNRRMEYVQVPNEDLPFYEDLRLIQEERRPQRPHTGQHPRSRASSTGNSKRRKLSHTPDDIASPTAQKHDDDDDEGDDEDGRSESLSQSTARTSPSPPPRILLPDHHLYRSREKPTFAGQSNLGDHKLQARHPSIEYVPSFLPPFPGQRVGAVAEFHAGQVQSINTSLDRITEPARSPSALPPVVKIEEEINNEHGESDSPSSSYLPSYFTPPIAFSASPTYGQEPTAEADVPQIEDTSKSPRETSSLSAFITGYIALATKHQAGVYLPASALRRRMAVSLTSPASYTPTDTLYGGIPARPSASPFTPSASHLITLPPGGEGAPRFTPTNPKGRPLDKLPTGISNAVLAYRHPTSIMDHLSRYFASQAPLPFQPLRGPDGTVLDTHAAVKQTPSTVLISSSPVSASSSYLPNLSILHRCLHIMDPEPLRDELHVERVFRGVTLSGGRENSLTRPESWFKSAIDAVKVVSVGGSGVGGSSANGINGHGGRSAAAAATKKASTKRSSKTSKSKSRYYEDDIMAEEESSSDEDSSDDDEDGTGGAGQQEDVYAVQARKRAAMKIKSGTVVYTWDWESKEYTDVVE